LRYAGYNTLVSSSYTQPPESQTHCKQASGKQIFGYRVINSIADADSYKTFRVEKKQIEKQIEKQQTNTKNSSEIFILTVLKAPSSSPSAIARLKQAFHLICEHNVDGIVKTYEAVEHGKVFVIVQEDFDGVTLRSLIPANGRMDLLQILEITIEVAKVLGDLHLDDITHGNINPNSILLRPDSLTLKLTKFGIMFGFIEESKAIYHKEPFKSSLQYRSPEQTQRMNRSVDYRTDFYSLGITLYEMLTGVTPFQSADPMAVVHAHIAKMPVSPMQRDASIPPIISDIVMKLITKNVEDRYQNGFGLVADLLECKRQIENDNWVNTFELGKKDFSNSFHVPHLLLGRERESGELMSVFERLGSSSEDGGTGVEVVLVTGAPGVGKSALINELRQPVAVNRGYFISGKYDQLKKSEPYSAIIQAFQEMIEQILTESDEKIQFWQDRLSQALGPNGKVIAEVIPNIELITGTQPELITVGAEESRNRFKLVFERFVSALASERHPVILFLDDLQWADWASLLLLKNIVTSHEVSHLCIVGAYRDNEVGPLDLLSDFIRELESTGVEIAKMELAPLDCSDVEDLVERVLKKSDDSGVQLSKLVHEKTRGNPFFVIQFLRSLYSEKLITLDRERGWTWDIDSIAHIHVTDNVVDLLFNKIQKLPEEIITVLKAASAIGGRFDLNTLSHIMGRPIESVLDDLTKTIDEGLISYSPVRHLYAFNHDRIEEVVYSLVAETEKAVLHYRIGNKTLEKAIEEGLLAAKLFFIVDQLNKGVTLMPDDASKEQLAKLNYEAGVKAKVSSAFAPAFRYLEMGIECLGAKAWESAQYRLTLSLYTELVETAYLNGDYERMDSLLEIALSRVQCTLDKIDLISTKINARRSREEFESSIDTGLELLKELGLNLPRKPSYARVGIELLRTKIALRGRRASDLSDLPKMTDPNAIASTKIITAVLLSAFMADAEQFGLAVLVGVRLALKYGYAPHHSFIMTAYGVVISGTLYDYKGGVEFGQLGLNLIDKLDARDHLSKTLAINYGLLSHWESPLKDTIEGLEKGYAIGLETGDLDFSVFSLLMADIHQLLLGSYIPDLLEDLRIHNRHIQHLNQTHLQAPHRLLWQDVLNLAGRSDDPCVISGDAVVDEESLPKWRDGDNKMAIASLYFSRLSMHGIFNDSESTLVSAAEFRRYKRSVVGSSIIRLACALETNAMLMLYRKAPFFRKIKFRARIFFNMTLMKRWAFHAPANCLHIYTGMVALRAWLIDNDIEEAKLKFTETCGYFGNAEDTVIEALNHEYASLFYEEIGYRQTAESHLLLAYKAYGRWGAHGKQNQLKERYPHLCDQHESR